jgi:uncharacterized OB-fold protein
MALPRFTADGLIGGRCASCHRRHFPAAEWCPWCGAESPAEVQLSTHGVLWSWTAVSSPPPGYVGPVPFGFGVVELPDDGLRVVTRLTEPDPARLRAGQRMVFAVVALAPDLSTWAFAPLAGR